MNLSLAQTPITFAVIKWRRSLKEGRDEERKGCPMTRLYISRWVKYYVIIIKPRMLSKYRIILHLVLDFIPPSTMLSRSTDLYQTVHLLTVININKNRNSYLYIVIRFSSLPHWRVDYDKMNFILS